MCVCVCVIWAICGVGGCAHASVKSMVLIVSVSSAVDSSTDLCNTGCLNSWLGDRYCDAVGGGGKRRGGDVGFVTFPCYYNLSALSLSPHTPAPPACSTHLLHLPAPPTTPPTTPPFRLARCLTVGLTLETVEQTIMMDCMGSRWATLQRITQFHLD